MPETIDQRLAILAKAILELSEKAACTWDFDGEQMTAPGVLLKCERELREIAAMAEALPVE